MKIGIITIAYNSGPSIERLMDSVTFDAERHDIMFYVFTHSAHEQTLRSCWNAQDIYPVKLFDYQENRGLAKSWNEGIIRCYDDGQQVIIIANDDIYFTAGDVDKIARKAWTSPKSYMVSVAGWHEKVQEHRPSHGYSCFALNPIAWDRIGAFDQNFHPAYFEDTDHHRRANMQNLFEENCPDTNVIHDGSMSVDRDGIKSLSYHQTMFARNHAYFMVKWGVNDIKGGYDHPFNDSKYSLYIDPDKRDNPYPEHRRVI